MEEWKLIQRNPYYSISNFGKVRNNKTNRILKDIISKDGYNTVIIKIEGKNKHLYVHRLVGEEFIEKIKDKNFINHKDGNKLNNFYENLEWCTSQENNIHALKNGLIKNPPGLKGSAHPNAKLTEEQIIEIRLLSKTQKLSGAEIGRRFNTTRQNIYPILSGKCWKHIK